MKHLYLLLLLPFSVLADYLTPAEIDQLVDSAFNSDKGMENVYRVKNHARPGLWPWVIFINVEGGDYEVTEEWMAEIHTVTAELSQLTGQQFTIMPEVKTWDRVREIVMDKPIANMVIYFSKLGGIDGRATANRTSVRIHINGQKNENAIKHLIREEMTNTMGLLGDTWRDSHSIFYQGGTSPHTTEFTETDRRIIYAYFHFDRNETQGWAPVYEEEEFREKIAKFPIDDEKVYQGLFADKLPFKPGWLYYNHYPWVYCGRSNSWYYLCANQDASYLWSERSSQWSLMENVFKLN
jgi:hypothetical protein